MIMEDILFNIEQPISFLLNAIVRKVRVFKIRYVIFLITSGPGQRSSCYTCVLM